MADLVIERTTIEASPQRCFAVAIDFARYPEWAHDLREVTIVNTDAEGRGLDVAFRAAAFGHSSSYTLHYDYGDAPQRLAWELTEGDVTRKLDGFYEFLPVPDDPDKTEVNYRLEVELVLPLPGFVKRRTESKIMNTALRDLKARVESTGS